MPWSASSPGWKRRTACSIRANARSWRTTRWGTRCGDGSAGVDPVHKVSIIPRELARSHYPAPDRGPLPDDAGAGEQDRSPACGRAAEKIIYNHVSTGAADDLVKATISPAPWSRGTGWTKASGMSATTAIGQAFGTGDQSSWLNRRYSEPLPSGWTRRCATSGMACSSAPSRFSKPTGRCSSNPRRISCNARHWTSPICGQLGPR